MRLSIQKNQSCHETYNISDMRMLWMQINHGKASLSMRDGFMGGLMTVLIFLGLYNCLV